MRAAYFFDEPPGMDSEALRRLLGGKGAGLVTMCAGLGLPVPPGFTVPTTLCRVLDGRAAWPDAVEQELRAALRALEQRLERRLGDPSAPLFVSVRSGAPRSMPGMLETILNVGSTPATVRALARQGEDFAWQSYGRFLRSYGSIVLGIAPPPRDAAAPRDDPPAGRAMQERDRLLAQVPAELLDDPWQQLKLCIGAVFRSWDQPRAVAYRQRAGESDESGTAASVQAMVFGNADADSGTGVYFTRDPNSGEPHPYGDYLAGAQGEDVVAGTHRTAPLAALAASHPAAYAELLAAGRVLEHHLRDMCDIEFTLERGRLWLLQVRPGKRSATAAVRIALDLTDDPVVRLGVDEVRARVSPDTLAGLAAARRTLAAEPAPLARGLGASPGVASGHAYFSADAAVEAAERGESVVLVAEATSPADVHAFAVAAGVLTASGGLVSHAALVAREWGLPAVVGVAELQLETSGELRVGGVAVREGEPITIDGTRGLVYVGALSLINVGEDPLLARLRDWCRANGQPAPA